MSAKQSVTFETVDQVATFLKQQNEQLGSRAHTLLASSDGTLIAASDMDAETGSRFSAMSSALLSLSETLCTEVLGSANDHASLSSGKGHIVLVRLILNQKPYLMMTSCPVDTNLASLMRHSRDVAVKLAESLRTNPISL